MKIIQHKKFDIGINIIDNQHKKTIKQINKILELIISESTSYEIETAGDDLIEIVEGHNETEERLLLKPV